MLVEKVVEVKRRKAKQKCAIIFSPKESLLPTKTKNKQKIPNKQNK